MSPIASTEPPLCVDLDGTLVAADTLHRSILLLARSKPWRLLELPFALLGGRARLKRRITDLALIDAASLPYRADVVDWVRAEKAAGRRVILCTAADHRIAAAVAAHLGLFDGVVASDGSHNAKGIGKVEAIAAFLSGGEFDYVGDSVVDLPVLQAARHGVLVCPHPALERRARASCRIVRVFPRG